MARNGNAYSRVTRQMLVDFKEEAQKDIKEIKCDINKLVNHYSKRLPLWTSILMTILSSLVVGLLVRGVYHG